MYFIRPRNGGAVWFNALGWPWPKHGCMDTYASRTTSPTHVPLHRNKGTVPIGWSRHPGYLWIQYSEEHRCWTTTLGAERLYFPQRPPESLSPMFAAWNEEDDRLGTIEYLALIENQVEDVSIEIFRAPSWYWTRRAHSGEVAWPFLVSMVMAHGHQSQDRAEKLIDEIRKAVDWIIEPEWSFTISGPHLVLSAIRRVLGEPPLIDPKSILIWLILLSR